MKYLFEKAYRESGKAQKNTADGGGEVRAETKYSISETTDGRFAAVVDNDILSNIDTTTWDKTTKDAAKKAASEALKKFSDGIVVDGITRKVNKISRREYTRSNDTEKLYNRSPDVFADKMRAADVAEDIVIAATNWNRDGGLKHPRKDNFVDFDHGNTLIASGDAQYSAEVVVGITDTGEAVFYDVVDMTPTTFDIKKEESPTTATTQNAIGDIQGDSSMQSLTQNGDAVKRSLSDGGKRYDNDVTHQAGHSAQADITAKFQTTVDQVLNMQNTQQDHAIIGYTPDIYEKLGMPSLPFVIGTGHIYSAAKTEAEAKQDGNYRKNVHYHGLGDGIVKNIYEKLKDPVMIIASKDVSKNAAPMRSTHSVVAIVDVGNAQKSLLLPVEITAERTVNGVQMDVNALSSIYEKTVTNLVAEAIAQENSGEVGIFYAKKEAMTLPAAGVQFPIRLQQSIASNSIVHRFPEKVNMNIQDATQSRQFKRWFGDWQNDPDAASKVVNPDGTPKVMYHGTKAENGEFYEFDQSKAVRKGGLGLKAMGKGNYFTAKKLDGTERYGSRVIPAYLDIKHPFEFNGGNFYELAAKAIGIDGPVSSDVLQAEMRRAGYDGVIQYDKNGDVSIAVTFDSNQIKSATDNVGTFDGRNPDIRYSLSDAGKRHNGVALEAEASYPDDLAPVRKDLIQKPEAPGSREDLAPVGENVRRNDGSAPQEAETPAGDDLTQAQEEILQMPEENLYAEKLVAKWENSKAEAENLERLREEAVASYDRKVEALQAQYDGKRNKDTKTAGELLRRIERLKRLRADADADYKNVIESGYREGAIKTPAFKMKTGRPDSQRLSGCYQCDSKWMLPGRICFHCPCLRTYCCA